MFEKFFKMLGYTPEKKEESQEFNLKRVFDDMAQEGFRLLIKNDILMQRNKDIKEGMDDIIKMFHEADTPEKKRLCLRMAVTLVYIASSAWMRGMDNRWLARKVGLFLSQYNLCYDVPSLWESFLIEAHFIVNLAWTNADVEPLKPLIIHSTHGKERIDAGRFGEEE